MSDPRAEIASRGLRRRPAWLFLSGAVAAMAGGPVLAGACGFLASAHQTAKGIRHGIEELTTDSLECFAGAEE